MTSPHLAPTSPRLLTAAELAAYLGLKPATILDKWERGELPGYKFGRAVRFDLDEILELGRRRPTRQRPEEVL